MNDNRIKIPAYIILRLISSILVVAGISLLSIAGIYALSAETTSIQYSLGMLFFGIILLLIAGIGPIRVMLHGAQIPVEIKRTIAIQAIVLPLSGIVFIVAGLTGSATYEAWAYFITGICVFCSALAGFYPLSKTLPDTFYIDEMLSIIKSAGITGDKLNSQANQAFQRWATGRKGVAVGNKAPDGTVVTLDGEKVPLSSFFEEKLLVLNFASYSCPHHRKRMDELQALMEKWQHKGVNFLTVYTAEAHAEDGWKLVGQYINDAEYTNENEFCFPYAKSIDERKEMAMWMIDKKHFAMPVVLDSMENSLLKAYNSWPIRLYLIKDREVVYCGDQGPFGYNPTSVDLILQHLLIR